LLPLGADKNVAKNYKAYKHTRLFIAELKVLTIKYLDRYV